MTRAGDAVTLRLESGQCRSRSPRKIDCAERGRRLHRMWLSEIATIVPCARMEVNGGYPERAAWVGSPPQDAAKQEKRRRCETHGSHEGLA